MTTNNQFRVLVIVSIVTVLVSVLLAALVAYTRAYIQAELIIAVVGLLISIYIFLYHYFNVPLVCPRNKLVDCKKVLDSKYSFILGQMTSILGLVFFVAEPIVIVFYPSYLLWLNVLGILYVVERLYAQTKVGSICIYCTGIYIVVLTLFILSLHGVAF